MFQRILLNEPTTTLIQSHNFPASLQ